MLLLVASFSLQGAQGGSNQDASAAGGQTAAPAAIPAARQAKNVAIITIRGEIDAVTEKSVKRRIKLAETEGADAIVIELDTPGGEVGAVLEICNAIKRSSITNTVAWVNPNAYSGGAIVALACREIVASDNATLGDALPISVGLFGMINDLPDAERQKFLIPLLVEVVDSARRNGYDEKLVQGIVSRGVELWLVENAQTGERLFVGRDEYKLLFGQDPPPGETPAIPSAAGGASATQPPPGLLARPTDESGDAAGGGAPPRDGLFAQSAADPDKQIRPATPAITPEMASQISENLDRSSTRPRLTAKDRGQWRMIQYVSDGQGLIVVRTADMKRFGLAVKTINTDQELKDFFGATNMQRLNRSWSEVLVVAMTNIVVRAVLIVIFLLGLFIEMTHPGLMLPGAVAMLALVLLIVPPFLNDMAAWWEILAIAAGLLLVAAEVFLIPGTGLAGILGMILLFAGLVGTFVGGGSGLFPDSPERQSDLLWGAVTVLLSLAVSGVLMYFFARHFGSMPLVGRLVLQDTDPEAGGGGLLAAMASPILGPVAPGEEGVAITPLRPSGRVQFEQDVLDASADFDYVDAGSRVRVVRVEGLRIVVEAIRGDEANPSDGNADQSREA